MGSPEDRTFPGLQGTPTSVPQLIQELAEFPAKVRFRKISHRQGRGRRLHSQPYGSGQNRRLGDLFSPETGQPITRHQSPNVGAVPDEGERRNKHEHHAQDDEKSNRPPCPDGKRKGKDEKPGFRIVKGKRRNHRQDRPACPHNLLGVGMQPRERKA